MLLWKLKENIGFHNTLNNLFHSKIIGCMIFKYLIAQNATSVL